MILVVILLILMALLRSILAPILLILTTVLSFGAALGVSAVVFNGIFAFHGADPAVPLLSFVFLVALGIDDNIFLMTRVREELHRHSTREGLRAGLASPVVSSHLPAFCWLPRLPGSRSSPSSSSSRSRSSSRSVCCFKLSSSGPCACPR